MTVDQLQQLGTDLGIAVAPEQAERLADFLSLLQRWNGTYNLTAIRDPAAMVSQHLADCLAVVLPLDRQLKGATARLLDVGSGGGLPGVVLAVMLPNLAVTCVDAVGKKAAFVRQVAAELGLRNLESRHGRVEQLKQADFDVAASRAFASLPDFARLTEAAVGPGGIWMAMKGKPPLAETAALPRTMEVFHVEQLQVPGLAAERCLIWMRRAGGGSAPNL